MAQELQGCEVESGLPVGSRFGQVIRQRLLRLEPGQSFQAGPVPGRDSDLSVEGGEAAPCFQPRIASAACDDNRSRRWKRFGSRLEKLQAHFASAILNMAMRILFSAVAVRISKSLFLKRAIQRWIPHRPLPARNGHSEAR